ncbi:hypothetical protein SAMN05216186_13036 [Pseudomonas indica]|jgi:hypothetical protein|uniref:Lipoprotein n=2 Tax=Pseudomonas indica TaxID=137658 RepID=A0A1G9MTP8_9PSED|nr:hypothetical protein BZL42_24150 [Pseudomonas indica]SDL77638.1 hypothetical protein SAMN05216186_13036 [Pseudomonas indica]
MRTGWKGIMGGVVLATLAACGQAADERQPPPDDGKPRMPPPEAFAACAGKTEGAAVSFTGRDGKRAMKGVCRDFDGKLAAAPDHPPGGPGGGDREGPPPGPPPGEEDE